jgi:hypothetical protein
MVGGLWFTSNPIKGHATAVRRFPFASASARCIPHLTWGAACGAGDDAIGTRRHCLYSYVAHENDKRTRVGLAGAHATGSGNHDLGVYCNGVRVKLFAVFGALISPPARWESS